MRGQRIAQNCAELRRIAHARHLRERPRGLSVALRQRVERRHRLLAPVQAEQTVRRSTLAEQTLRARFEQDYATTKGVPMALLVAPPLLEPVLSSSPPTSPLGPASAATSRRAPRSRPPT